MSDIPDISPDANSEHFERIIYQATVAMWVSHFYSFILIKTINFQLLTVATCVGMWCTLKSADHLSHIHLLPGRGSQHEADLNSQ